MAGQPLTRTRWPGIYRRGDRFVYQWTDGDGKVRRATVDTAGDARREKALREEEARTGQLPAIATRGSLTLAAYALDLFGADLTRGEGDQPVRGRYQGRRGAVRASTLAEYRRDLERYILPTLGSKPLQTIAAPDLARLAAHLAGREAKAYIADRTLRRIFAPLSALLGTAVEEGLAKHNAARDVRLPSGRDELRRFDADDQGDPDDPAPGEARPFTREQLGAFMLVVDPRWRLFYELLAATGLRVSEAIPLRWQDLRLNGSAPAVLVRRAYVKGTFGPPKSKHGRRAVPIGHELVRSLRARHAASEWPDPDGLVFPSEAGTPMLQENLRRRTLEPAREEADVAWAGFHTFRHTCASLLISDARNIVQVSRWLGHHSPSFTLDVYAHLMDEGVGEAIDLAAVTTPVLSLEEAIA